MARAAGDAVVADGSAAVEGEAVAEAGTGLDVVQQRAAAGPVQPDRGTRRLRVAGGPGELHAHVAQRAGGALRVAAAVGRPLGGQHARGHALQARHRGLAEDAQPGPAARLAVAGGRGAGQHHGGLAGALGHDPAAGLDDDGGVGAEGLQQGAGLDGEGGAGVHEQLVAEVVEGVGAQGQVGADLAVEAGAVEQHGALGDGELGPGPAGAQGRGGLGGLLGGLAGAQLQHELPQAGAGGLALEGQLAVGGGEGLRGCGAGGLAAGIDRLGMQLALGRQRGQPAALAAAGRLQPGEGAVAAAVVVGLEAAVQPHGLAGAVAGLVGPQRQLQRLRVARPLLAAAGGVLRILRVRRVRRRVLPRRRGVVVCDGHAGGSCEAVVCSV